MAIATHTNAPTSLDRRVVAFLLLVMLAMTIAAIGPRGDVADGVSVPSYLEISNDSIPTGLSFLAN